MKWCNNRKCFLELNPWCVWRVRVNEESKTSYVDRCSWCTTPCTVRRGRRPRRRWSRRTASCCCTTCTRSCCWCTRCRWLSWRTASGTAWRCGWLRNNNFDKFSSSSIFQRQCLQFEREPLSGSQRSSGWTLLDYDYIYTQCCYIEKAENNWSTRSQSSPSDTFRSSS